uniref:Carboxylic ester hydrolase n=1 Tax=Arion vulgaris TaxID=1028688 RepID=A0A0B7BAT8_9EUPU
MLPGDYITKIVALGQLVILLLSGVIQVSCDSPIVDTDKGKVRGFSETIQGKKLDIFYGIPYAAPPLGDLRYSPPIQNEPWKGILDATQQPNCCYQSNDEYFGNFTGSTMWNPNTNPSEDCLYLSVWVPRTHPPYKDKAVIVWIYGGGFSTGSSTLDIYQPSYLAVENDVIVVSMQYRVGSLGFLALDTPEAPGNAGIWDQRMALQWVARNIHNFGGSAHNVTLMGESAGAGSVGLFLLCDLCTGLFQRAILQSGAPQASWAAVPKQLIKNRSEQFAQSVGCNQQTDDEYRVRCLRSLTYNQTILSREYILTSGIIQPSFVPIVDGILLRQEPAQLLRTGNFKKTPILIGSNQNEGTFFLAYIHWIFNLNNAPVITSALYHQLMTHVLFRHYPYHPFLLNEFGLDAIMFHYRDWLDPENHTALSVSLDNAVGDCFFVCPVNKLARTYAKHKLPVYYYWFSQRWTANPWPEWMGVLHADEIWYTFGHPFNSSHSFTEEERQLSRKMMTYWTNFAKTGDPNQAPGELDLPEWPKFKHDEQMFLNLSVASFASGHPWGQGPRTQHCAFWDDYLPKLVHETSNFIDVKKELKEQFNEWKTHYIVEWKTQLDNFLSTYQRRRSTCGGGR